MKKAAKVRAYAPGAKKNGRHVAPPAVVYRGIKIVPSFAGEDRRSREIEQAMRDAVEHAG